MKPRTIWIAAIAAPSLLVMVLRLSADADRPPAAPPPAPPPAVAPPAASRVLSIPAGAGDRDRAELAELRADVARLGSPPAPRAAVMGGAVRARRASRGRQDRGAREDVRGRPPGSELEPARGAQATRRVRRGGRPERPSRRCELRRDAVSLQRSVRLDRPARGRQWSDTRTRSVAIAWLRRPGARRSATLHHVRFARS